VGHAGSTLVVALEDPNLVPLGVEALGETDDADAGSRAANRCICQEPDPHQRSPAWTTRITQRY
jgi:hypothetical protein